MVHSFIQKKVAISKLIVIRSEYQSLSKPAKTLFPPAHNNNNNHKKKDMT
jgi:hypothetical protein